MGTTASIPPLCLSAPHALTYIDELLLGAAAAAGKACDLLEFVFHQLQKRVGIVNAVIEVG